MKRNVFISCLLASMITSSCTSTQDDVILESEQDTKFSISLTSSNEKFKTRGNGKIGEASESELKHVAFYVFKKSGSLETSVSATPEEISNGSYTVDCTTGDKYVYAITNDSELYQQVAKGIQLNEFEALVTKQFITGPTNPFTMVGKHPDLLTLKPTTDTSIPSQSIQIDVTRLVGKVTVSLSTLAASKFDIVQFKIVNANPYSNYFLKNTSYKKDAVDPIPNDYTDYPAFNEWTDNYYVDTYAYVQPGAAAYALENWNTDPRRGNTTCIIIEGLYKGEGASGKNTFYRFNLGGKSEKWAFNRNTHYNVNISDVYEDGYTDEKEAEKPNEGKPTDPLVQDVNIEASLQITPWGIVNQNDEIGKE